LTIPGGCACQRVCLPIRRISPTALETFNAGGCFPPAMRCPVSPIAPGSAAGLAIPSPFGTFHVPNISPDSVDGIGRWTETDFVNAVMKRDLSRRKRITFRPFHLYVPTSMPGSKTSRDLFAYLKNARAGPGPGARFMMLPFPLQYQAQCRNLEMAVQWTASRLRPMQPARLQLESRRLSRQQPRPLRGSATAPEISSAAIVTRAALCGRPRSGRQRAGCRTSRKGARRMERKGTHRPISSKPEKRNRENARWRQAAGGSMAPRGSRNTSQLSSEDRTGRSRNTSKIVAAGGTGPPRPKKAGEQRRQVLIVARCRHCGGSPI